MSPVAPTAGTPRSRVRTASLAAAGALLLLQLGFVGALFGAKRALGSLLGGAVSVYTLLLLFMTLAPWALTWVYLRAIRGRRLDARDVAT